MYLTFKYTYMVHLERIKELCEKKNVTMKQAAIELGMTEQSLHKIIKANTVVYPAVKNAHFQLPDSCLIAANVAIHGKYISTNNI